MYYFTKRKSQTKSEFQSLKTQDSFVNNICSSTGLPCIDGICFSLCTHFLIPQLFIMVLKKPRLIVDSELLSSLFHVLACTIFHVHACTVLFSIKCKKNCSSMGSSFTQPCHTITYYSTTVSNNACFSRRDRQPLHVSA